MTLGIAVFAAAFVIGLAVGTYTRRPFVTACFLTGCFAALVVSRATGEAAHAATAFALVFVAGLVIDSVRETFALIVGR